MFTKRRILSSASVAINNVLQVYVWLAYKTLTQRVKIQNPSQPWTETLITNAFHVVMFNLTGKASHIYVMLKLGRYLV